MQSVGNFPLSQGGLQVGLGRGWGRVGRAQTKQLVLHQSRHEPRGLRLQAKREKGAQQRNGTRRMGRAAELMDRGFGKGTVLGGRPPSF